MVLDYSKWDNLELSDDSDIEVHPNVDKPSFIRAKQNQIHQERYQRRHQIETLKYERIINDGLLTRIDSFINTLQAHGSPSVDADELVFHTLVEAAGDPSSDQPPPRPEGVHAKVEEQPTYSKMMGALVDQVKKAVDESKSDSRWDKYLSELRSHQQKVQNLQKELQVKLDELEKVESRKITSDSIHTGFDSSYVSKGDKQSGKETQTDKTKSVELLNPQGVEKGESSSGAGADAEDADKDSIDEHIEPSKIGKEFAKIKIGDYKACLNFISENPSVVAEKETDGLLIEAFNSQIEGQDEYARQCVHQALLLQYCRQLGKDGVGLFFKRISTPSHQAQKVFRDDVSTTYDRIRTRAAELAKERSSTSAGVEQIQLQAVDPNTKITINIPPPTDTTACEIFSGFSTDLQKSLESGSLDEVNKVLGEMSVEEAEGVVAKLGEGGMLSLEEGVIDATTEEGREALRRFEEGERGRGKQEEAVGDTE
ncbi:MAG: hsp90 co-chaperone Cdc37 [Geoglossum simile]|nr:MAG: hsp90 co-chaperone Cdc37 [Geoglossum simile]